MFWQICQFGNCCFLQSTKSVDIYQNVVEWILEGTRSKLNKKKEKWWGLTLLLSMFLSPRYTGSRHQPCLGLVDGVWLRPDLMNACLQGMTLTSWFSSLQESRIVLEKRKEWSACFIHRVISCSFKYEAADVCFLFWLSRLFLSHLTEKVSTSGLWIFWYQTILHTQVWAMLWTWDNMVSTWCALRESVCLCVCAFEFSHQRMSGAISCHQNLQTTLLFLFLMEAPWNTIKH